MRYLVLRKQIYHYKRRIPTDVAATIGQKFWKQSLKTSGARDAEIRARALGAQHDQLIRRIRELPELQKLQMRRDMLEQRQVEAILRITRAERAERWTATKTHRAAASAAHNQRIEAEDKLTGALGSTVQGAPALLDQLKQL
jgi:TolA-binding protein